MKTLFFSLFFLIVLKISAQQDVQYTHYMYNMSLINPAYTTDDFSTINMGLLYRTQWVGIDGSLTSANAFFHAPLKNNIEIGATFLNDNINDVIKENNINIDVAYKLILSRNSNLSFGIKSGMGFLTNNFRDFMLESGDASTDEAFSENLKKSFFNFGAGVYFNTEKFYLGLSVPNFIRTEHLQNDDSNLFVGKEEIHAYLTAGYVFSLSNKVKLKPSFLLKGVEGAPLTYDINANGIYDDKFEVGLGYRFEDAFTAVVNINITPVLKVGYSYDYNISKLNNFNSGSHEIILLYDLVTLYSGYEKSPRYF